LSAVSVNHPSAYGHLSRLPGAPHTGSPIFLAPLCIATKAASDCRHKRRGPQVRQERGRPDASIERQVRRAIAPDLTLQGLYVGQPAKPTGRLVFEALAHLRLIPASGNDPPIIPQPQPLQARLLQLLDVDPTQAS